MEMKEDKNVVINIYGGTQQILPNATQAVQHFYGADISRDVFREGALSRQELSPEAKRLSAYINNVEELGVYLTRLSGCITASELALVVVSMVENRTGVSKELMVRESFIRLLLPLTPGITSGRSIDNIRARINDAWARRPKKVS
ncbi:hypothetical protein [Parabacteroides distasonis]|uniref:Uncharacterized protein n=1 Tax=Parabacteroides distasonis TaxID=823 RepID=A0A3L7ZKZ3_PARDI|nr:hypothetical protein [Parabacteroides distasonis]NBH89046.1 hypothetical protein [Parabacteroides distasonis]RLT72379.1 hypothetical protein D7V78_16250 [Parabacteroides distasonis]TGY56459.1 hypothetical protein E5342_12175 [Parabacteroides distasonis]